MLKRMKFISMLQKLLKSLVDMTARELQKNYQIVKFLAWVKKFNFNLAVSKFKL